MPSTFVTSSTLNYLATISGGKGWVDMVKAYLQLEQLPVPKDVCNFFSFFLAWY